jgi:hypothetical protein
MRSSGNVRTPGYPQWDSLTRGFSKYAIRPLTRAEANEAIEALRNAQSFMESANIIKGITKI